MFFFHPKSIGVAQFPMLITSMQYVSQGGPSTPPPDPPERYGCYFSPPHRKELETTPLKNKKTVESCMKHDMIYMQ